MNSRMNAGPPNAATYVILASVISFTAGGALSVGAVSVFGRAAASTFGGGPPVARVCDRGDLPLGLSPADGMLH